MLQTLAEVCALCNDARIEFKAGHHKAVGQPTEAALLVLAEKLGVAGDAAQKGIRALRLADPEAHPTGACQHHAAKWRKLATLEFDRDRKVCTKGCAAWWRRLDRLVTRNLLLQVAKFACALNPYPYLLFHLCARSP